MHQAEEGHPQGSGQEVAGLPLGQVGEEVEEGEEEPSHHPKGSHPVPGFLEAPQVELHLVGEVRPPDDDEGGGLQVDPDDGEGEEEVGVVLGLAQKGRRAPPRGQGHAHGQGQDGGGEEDDAPVGGGVEVGLEAHEEVKGEEGARHEGQGNPQAPASARCSPGLSLRSTQEKRAKKRT